MTDILDRLSHANSCIERGLDKDRDMSFSVNGSGPGSSTWFSIERDIFWAAHREIKKLRAEVSRASYHCD